jgi:hypothetical protein
MITVVVRGYLSLDWHAELPVKGSKKGDWEAHATSAMNRELRLGGTVLPLQAGYDVCSPEGGVLRPALSVFPR